MDYLVFNIHHFLSWKTAISSSTDILQHYNVHKHPLSSAQQRFETYKHLLNYYSLSLIWPSRKKNSAWKYICMHAKIPGGSKNYFSYTPDVTIVKGWIFQRVIKTAFLTRRSKTLWIILSTLFPQNPDIIFDSIGLHSYNRLSSWNTQSFEFCFS